MSEHELKTLKKPSEKAFQLNGSAVFEPEDVEGSSHELDSAENQTLHTQLVNWRQYESDLQFANRIEMAIDEDYRDHKQYTTEELRILAERSQAPAIANEVKPIIDYLVGTERRMRVEGKALPREKNDRGVAIAKTNLMKYLSDQNHEPMERSLAFKEVVSAGLSWMYCGLRGENEDGEAVTTYHESWRNVLYDSYHHKLDYSDARYWFRHRFVDVDVAKAFFKDRLDILNVETKNTFTPAGEINHGNGWYLGERLSDRHATSELANPYVYGRSSTFRPNNQRDRLMLIEAWWRMPQEVKHIITPGQFFGVRVNADDGPLNWVVKKQKLETKTTIKMVPQVAIMTTKGFLAKQETPFRHNRFPGVPLWCYRTSNDRQPYGVIRGLRDQQDLINKRRSKAVFLLSTNQVIIDKGLLDPEQLEVMREQIAAPNGVIEVPITAKRFEIRRDAALAQQLEQAAIQDKAYMRETSGASTEALGMQSNATSGRAVVARQGQSAIASAEIFDNYAFGLQICGEINLANSEEFMPHERMVRVLNDRGIEQFTQINGVDPETGEPVNPITESRADYYIDMEDFRESSRRAAYEELMNLMSQLAPTAPQLVSAVLDIVIDASDVPGAERIAKRVRAITGQRDEDAQPSKEEEAQMQQQAQERQVQEQLKQRGVVAEIANKEATTDKLRADINVLQANANKLNSEQLLSAVTAIEKALAAAGVLAAAPAIGEIAAQLVQGADVPGGQAAPVLPSAPQAAEPQPMPQQIPNPMAQPPMQPQMQPPQPN